MKIKNATTSHKKLIIIILATALVVVGGYTAIAATSGMWPFASEERDDKNTSDDNTNEKSDDSKQTEDTNDSEEMEGSNVSGSNEQTSSSGNNGSEKSSATINIPSYQASDGKVLVNVAISESWNSGECVMALSGPNSQTVREDVFPQAQISGCQLEANNLPSGTYKATIYAERNGQRTSSETLELRL